MPKRTCAVPECQRDAICRGWCTMHYARWRSSGDPEKLKPIVRSKRIAVRGPCSVEGCEQPYSTRGWCTRHYGRWRVTGDPLGVLKPGKEDWNQPCSVDGCDDLGPRRGLCVKHYKRLRKNGDTETVLIDRSHDGTCKVEGCTRGYMAKGYCAMHYQRLKTDGDPGELAPRWNYGPPTCSVPDCERPHRAKGYCISHFQTLVRKRRLRAAFVEPVHVTVLIERDGWVCGLCTEPIDPTLEWPDPMSFSIDHVVPVSRGGKHSYANTQPAHLGCNCRKKDRLPDTA